MPARLHGIITEDSFYSFRERCIRARDRQELDAITASFNNENGWNNAVSVNQDDNSVGDVLGSFFSTLIGTGGPLQSTERTIIFNMNLMPNAFATGTVPTQAYIVTPINPSAPLAPAQPLPSGYATDQQLPVAQGYAVKFS